MAFPFSLPFLSGGMSMKAKLIAVLALLCVLCLVLAGCGSKGIEPAATETQKADADSFAEEVEDKDFSGLRTPGSQEAAYEYRSFFQPAIDGIKQPYVGDTMPCYEDGTYYVYYLKEGGDSYNHSIYLATTKDFVTYTEYDDPIVESSRGGGQDGWAGTGSVVKVKDEYLFFYTGHASAETYEYMEKIMLARGSDPTHFEKVEDWAITPPDESGSAGVL